MHRQPHALRTEHSDEPVDYALAWARMKAYTQNRNNTSEDWIWSLTHQPVYTLGQAAEQPKTNDISPSIPIVRTDRGGQITYHGPGQLIVYPLIDLRRLDLKIQDWISMLETCIMQTLKLYGIEAHARREARGVYVGDDKIASIGLRVSKGCSYHGFALNVNMDLTPFDAINPCGYKGLKMTQVKAFEPNISFAQAQQDCLKQLTTQINAQQKKTQTKENETSS